jgi:nucleoside-diphosphate-sugar epimerase
VKVFVAGATGVLGAPLVRALVAAGHEVTGTSRTPARAASVDAAGARGVVCDALDRDAVFAAVRTAEPEVVIHQLTALPARSVDLRKGSDATNRLRREGTLHLVDAAVEVGARRVIAESIAFLYAPSGPLVATEKSPVMSARCSTRCRNWNGSCSTPTASRGWCCVTGRSTARAPGTRPTATSPIGCASAGCRSSATAAG